MRKLLEASGFTVIGNKILRSQVKAAAKVIAEAMRLPAELSDFSHSSDDHYYKEIDRFQKYSDMDWLEDYEVDTLMEEDFGEGSKKHQSKLDRVNKVLKDNGFRPQARFDLGDKGHFFIDFVLRPDLDSNVSMEKSEPKTGLLRTLDTDIKTFAEKVDDRLMMMAGAFSFTMMKMNYKITDKSFDKSVTFELQMRDKQNRLGKLTLKVGADRGLIHCQFLYNGEDGEPRVSAQSTMARSYDDLIKDIVKVANEAMAKKEKGVVIPF